MNYFEEETFSFSFPLFLRVYCLINLFTDFLLWLFTDFFITDFILFYLLIFVLLILFYFILFTDF